MTNQEFDILDELYFLTSFGMRVKEEPLVISSKRVGVLP